MKSKKSKSIESQAPGVCKNKEVVGDLRQAEYNPRKITQTQLDILGMAMQKFGDLGGIVKNVTTGNLVGGHQRVKHFDPSWTISKQPLKDKTGTVAVGWIETPDGPWAYREVQWDEQTEKAANLAANKHGGEFDVGKLKELLLEIDTGDLDIKLTGFDENELKKMIDWIAPGSEGGADEIPATPAIPKTKPGDLYSLGRHRILCGDSSDNKMVEKLMSGKKATVIFTDPPYGVAIGKKNAMLNTFDKAGRCLDDLEMDDMNPEELGAMLLKTFTLWREHMAEDCSVFVCSPQGGGLGMMMMMMKESGLEVKHILNWIKNAPTFSMGRLDYDYQHEPILFTWKKTHKRKKEGAFQTSLWTVDKPMANKEHPTMKPVELPKCAILNHSDPGDIVSDMFLGSGTTLIAAEQTGRSCFGMEVSRKYCDVIIRRWVKLTGEDAFHVDADGRKTISDTI